MSDKATTGLWTPEGFKALDGKQPTRVELKAGLGEWFVQWAAVAPVLKVSPRCDLCGTVFQGKNSESAKTYSVVCGCRELVFANRDYKAPTEFDFYQH